MINLGQNTKFENINNINNTLLIILLMLIIFCILFYIYNGVNINNIVKDEQINNNLDNKIVLLELIVNAKKNAQQKIKENFTDDTLISKNDAINYYNSINGIQSWLDNSYNGPNGMLANISSDLQTASNTRNIDKQELLNLLTNIYVINYINSTNRQNAEAYKVYLKYNKPENNKYYNQYLK